jgi:hypothetical protein
MAAGLAATAGKDDPLAHVMCPLPDEGSMEAVQRGRAMNQ